MDAMEKRKITIPAANRIPIPQLVEVYSNVTGPRTMPTA
jgi:hypothetical protein